MAAAVPLRRLIPRLLHSEYRSSLQNLRRSMARRTLMQDEHRRMTTPHWRGEGHSPISVASIRQQSASRCKGIATRKETTDVT
jgi:hypothetical protein